MTEGLPAILRTPNPIVDNSRTCVHQSVLRAKSIWLINIPVIIRKCKGG
jgi:hypothetical protein